MLKSEYTNFSENEIGELVYFSTQIVAGVNYGIVYELKNGKFECFKIYRNLQNDFQLTKRGTSKSLDGARSKCNF